MYDADAGDDDDDDDDDAGKLQKMTMKMNAATQPVCPLSYYSFTSQ